MRKLEETCAMDRVCCCCKNLKGLSRKNVFGEFDFAWYCTANCTPHIIMGCRNYKDRN